MGSGDLGRRKFLLGAAATAATATVVASCASDSSTSSTSSKGTQATTTLPNVEPVEIARPDALSEPVFKLGVASGDPTSESVILWTRLTQDPLDLQGLGAMGNQDVELAWDVSTDESFEHLIGSGTVTATQENGFSIHLDATGLEPATTYWYRFRLGDETSPIGRTRTLPVGETDKFTVAVVNCQWFETGQYGAYRHLQDEDLDLVMHLGDYIYEYPGGMAGSKERRSYPGHVVATLADYRLRYASYKLDENLTNAHARFPFIATWDDHEVANNYMGDTRPDGAPAEEVQAHKAAAYRAWWENLPVRFDPPEGSELAVYQTLDIGDLARIMILDQRQYSDLPPCREQAILPGSDYGDCEAVEGQDRSRLGEAQEKWLEEQLKTSTAQWNLLGNPVVLAGVNAGNDDDEYYLDTWDGFPQARRRLIGQLAGVNNPVVLTGDYHAAMTLEVREEPFDQESKFVAPEFMSPPISSTLFSADVSKRTPQLLEQINAHGYLAVEVTPEKLVAKFRTLEDVQNSQSAITTASTWVVEAGSPIPKKI